MATTTAIKICSTCGKDLNGQKRVKDVHGNYFCHMCWTEKAAQQPTSPSAFMLSDPPAPVAEASVLPKAIVRRDTGSLRRLLSLSLCVFGLLLGTAGLVYGGEAKVYVKHHPDLGVASFIIIAPLIAMFLMPLIILWTLGHALTEMFLTQSRLRRIIAGAISIFAVTVGITGYSRYVSIASLFNSKPSGTAFVDFDSQFGAGLVGNPSLMSKTGEQAESALKQYLGSMVKWKGIVLDVRDGQVLIEHRSSTMTNEVALVLGWWDAPSLRTLNKGDVVEYTGIISSTGSPYPYTLVNGTITDQHEASDEERNQLLKDTDTAVMDRMYKR